MDVLTPNAVAAIMRDEGPEDPVVQILTIKKISPGDSKGQKADRFRLTISDGTNKHNSAMLATQLNPMIVNEEVVKNGAIRLKKFMANTVQDRTIIIVLQAEVVAKDLGSVIGDPVGLGEKRKPAPAPAPSAATASRPAAPVKTENPYKSPPKPAMPSMAAASSGAYSPIMSLHPYLHRWTIRARVASKSNVRTWNNQRGSGRLFSVDLIDDSGEIRATGFNDVCDSLHPVFEVGKCYVIQGGKIKPANKRFNQLNNEYEMQFESDTRVTLDMSADNVIPQQKFDFKSFRELENTPVSRESNVFADVLAVCHSINDADTIITKATGRELTKRDITLLDRDGLSMTCTLWGQDAEDFEKNGGVVGAVLAIKAARVSDYNGRSLSVSQSSTMYINPDNDEAHSLKGWYDMEGATVEAKPLTVRNAGGNTTRILLSQIKDDQIGMIDGKPEYFMAVATVTYIKKDNCMYRACPSDSCNKKVIENGPEEYRCEKCNKSYPNFKWRLMTSMSIADATGQTWVTAFQESAEKLLDSTSQELGHLMENDEAAFSKKIADAQFRTWRFKCRAKADTYQDDTRVRVSVVDASPVNYVDEAAHLIQQINLYG
ncbi:hypothetical protein PTSG_10947 [Salpingoeca rosetta]|uniref:Replication protein A subunit n=1 Tax=Salpingoeca rosetta (strain ATCC 50818 / BSB-021) TaxID=946362 RepID=F2US95_SALR5|nr:uncharacterized protein PTSG_10947 [Salpingoeca rosetta]EGD81004.1 hypothetical protein PTSG_10947 [Salpingoeca rosetta]|eukprot:XP_004987874.1 hypothetical protein PTSG_10947 [Salpingoeca rosetta]